MIGLMKDGLMGLGLLTASGFVLLILIVATDPRGRRRHDLVHCTLCSYAATEAKVIEHERLDHPV